MKAVYTILFFTGTLLQILLFFLFLKFRDNGPAGNVAASLAGIAACIALQAYCLRKYIYHPTTHNP